MRKGYDAHIVLDKRGEIFAISTGSDACAEHECGSKALQEALCAFAGTSRQAPVSLLEKLATACGLKDARVPTDDEIIAQLRAGKSVNYPPLIARKTLNQNLEKLEFLTGTDKNGQPIAVFGFSPYGIKLDHNELSMWKDSEDQVGAWDERSFAIKVRGERLVGKLQRFAEKLKAGNGVFAGTFLTDNSPKERLAGVIIAVQSALRPEHRQAIADAQAKWEANLRLKAKSQEDELRRIYHTACKSHPNAKLPGFIWPVWKDGVVDGEVLYALNPYSGVDANYWGPYTFEQLKDWILAEKKFALRPIKNAA